MQSSSRRSHTFLQESESPWWGRGRPPSGETADRPGLLPSEPDLHQHWTSGEEEDADHGYWLSLCWRGFRVWRPLCSRGEHIQLVLSSPQDCVGVYKLRLIDTSLTLWLLQTGFSQIKETRGVKQECENEMFVFQQVWSYSGQLLQLGPGSRTASLEHSNT